MKKVLAALSLVGVLAPSIAMACGMPPARDRNVTREVMTTVTQREWMGRQSKRLIRKAAETSTQQSLGPTRFPRFKDTYTK
jgi:hypothetical protein